MKVFPKVSSQKFALVTPVCKGVLIWSTTTQYTRAKSFHIGHKGH